MIKRGLDKADRALVWAMGKRVDMALRYQRMNGLECEAQSVEAGVVCGLVE